MTNIAEKPRVAKGLCRQKFFSPFSPVFRDRQAGNGASAQMGSFAHVSRLFLSHMPLRLLRCVVTMSDLVTSHSPPPAFCFCFPPHVYLSHCCHFSPLSCQLPFLSRWSVSTSTQRQPVSFSPPGWQHGFSSTCKHFSPHLSSEARPDFKSVYHRALKIQHCIEFAEGEDFFFKKEGMA